ncbi:hypothetical protein [Streptococcus pneumoniae]|uniref:hypothetical protein n=1 Tax=Streptococcus pneumoniae TaxID=1313 RepID=UPI000A5DE3E5|nr:hypothetical protein [Streptococcus pneumoniae]
MKIKEQTRKLAVGCSKHSFEVVDKTDEVSSHTYGINKNRNQTRRLSESIT